MQVLGRKRVDCYAVVVIAACWRVRPGEAISLFRFREPVMGREAADVEAISPMDPRDLRVMLGSPAPLDKDLDFESAPDAALLEQQERGGSRAWRHQQFCPNQHRH